MESHQPGNISWVKSSHLSNVETHILVLQTARWTKVMTSRTSPFIDSFVQRLRQVGSLSDSSVGVDEQLPPVVEGKSLSGILFRLRVNKGNLHEANS